MPFGYNVRKPNANKQTFVMDFNQIRYFLAVADTLNFTQAADKCAISQPALSKAIQKLETSLGSELFDRNSQHVQLTAFGRTMHVHFESIEKNRRIALDAARVAQKKSYGCLNIGVLCTLGPKQVGLFLKQFHEDNPDVEIILHDVIGSVIPELLLSGSLDCVFCARDQRHDMRFAAIDLFDETMVVAFSNDHRFQAMNSVSLKEIAKERYLDRLHCEYSEAFVAQTRSSGLDLNVCLRSEREDWILSLIEENIGVGILPPSLAALSNISYRPISDLASMRTIELVSASTADFPLLKQFQTAAADFKWSNVI